MKFFSYITFLIIVLLVTSCRKPKYYFYSSPNRTSLPYNKDKINNKYDSSNLKYNQPKFKFKLITDYLETEVYSSYKYKYNDNYISSVVNVEISKIYLTIDSHNNYDFLGSYEILNRFIYNDHHKKLLLIKIDTKQKVMLDFTYKNEVIMSYKTNDKFITFYIKDYTCN